LRSTGRSRPGCDLSARPRLRGNLSRIVDAKRGLLDEGDVELSELARRAPWDYGPR
jgi:hypothetical protein